MAEGEFACVLAREDVVVTSHIIAAAASKVVYLLPKLTVTPQLTSFDVLYCVVRWSWRVKAATTLRPVAVYARVTPATVYLYLKGHLLCFPNTYSVY